MRFAAAVVLIAGLASPAAAAGDPKYDVFEARYGAAVGQLEMVINIPVRLKKINNHPKFPEHDRCDLEFKVGPTTIHANGKDMEAAFASFYRLQILKP